MTRHTHVVGRKHNCHTQSVKRCNTGFAHSEQVINVLWSGFTALLNYDNNMRDQMLYKQIHSHTHTLLLIICTL